LHLSDLHCYCFSFFFCFKNTVKTEKGLHNSNIRSKRSIFLNIPLPLYLLYLYIFANIPFHFSVGPFHMICDDRLQLPLPPDFNRILTMATGFDSPPPFLEGIQHFLKDPSKKIIFICFFFL